MASHSPAASTADSTSQIDSPASSSSDERPLELAIVGAGPCGIAAGAAARNAGLSTALFDRGPLCDSLVRYPYYMSFFSTPEKLEIEEVPFVTAEKNATRREALVYYRKVAEYFDLPVHQYHDVTGIQGDGEGGFVLTTRDRAGRVGRHRARRVVVATGGFHGPNLLNVPGEDLPKVSHHYREAHPFWRQDVLVVGGANSAVESALELYRAGARVNLVHFEEQFDRGVKPWILPDIENRIESGEVGIWWRHRVEEIRPASVALRSEATGELSEIPNDWVLAMTGWKASPTLLAELGVPVDGDSGIPEHDPETMETPVPGVFIAGVLAAGHDANRIFIENGRWHGRAIVASIEASQRTDGGG
jgi:thioredoxin reductase (NADPH)